MAIDYSKPLPQQVPSEIVPTPIDGIPVDMQEYKLAINDPNERSLFVEIAGTFVAKNEFDAIKLYLDEHGVVLNKARKVLVTRQPKSEVSLQRMRLYEITQPPAEPIITRCKF